MKSFDNQTCLIKHPNKILSLDDQRIPDYFQLKPLQDRYRLQNGRWNL